jgi:hypothetical protein
MDTAVLPEQMSPISPEAGETSLRTDGYVLRHLLDLETRAALLVGDAQAEADRRVAEGEKSSRARYDEVYAAEVAALETAYAEETAAIKADYKRQLDAYREGIRAMPLNHGAFSALAERFLIGEK